MVDNQFIKAVEALEKMKVITSQKDLAAFLGYKPQAFSEIMQGRSKVKTSIIQNFCKNYKINLYWLFYGEGEMFDDKNYLTNNGSINTGVNIGVQSSTVEGDLAIHTIEHQALVDVVAFLQEELKEKNNQLKSKDEIINRLMTKLEL